MTSFTDLFNKECECYDLENKELKTLLTLTKFKPSNTLIDIGAGNGRLSIPLSKLIKVTALEPNKDLLKEIKNQNITLINKKIEEFYPEQKFDYGLIAWPQFEDNKKTLEHIKNYIINPRGQLIVIQDIQNDYYNFATKIFPDITKNKKPRFLESLLTLFKKQKEKTINTTFKFSDLQTAQEISIFELSAFYDKELDESQKKKLINFLEKNKLKLNVKLKILIYIPNKGRTISGS